MGDGGTYRREARSNGRVFPACAGCWVGDGTCRGNRGAWSVRSGDSRAHGYLTDSPPGPLRKRHLLVSDIARRLSDDLDLLKGMIDYYLRATQYLRKVGKNPFTKGENLGYDHIQYPRGKLDRIHMCPVDERLPMRKHYIIDLNPDERAQLVALTRKCKASAR